MRTLAKTKPGLRQKRTPSGGRPPAMKSAVYFIQREGGGPIKIGHTKDIWNRLSVMQTGSLETLVCIAYCQGQCEAELHERFHHLCICGEWFKPDSELLEFIASVAVSCNFSRPLRSPRSVRIHREAKRGGDVNIGYLESELGEVPSGD